jgi:hypothetical protein
VWDRTRRAMMLSTGLQVRVCGINRHDASFQTSQSFVWPTAMCQRQSCLQPWVVTYFVGPIAMGSRLILSRHVHNVLIYCAGLTATGHVFSCGGTDVDGVALHVLCACRHPRRNLPTKYITFHFIVSSGTRLMAVGEKRKSSHTIPQPQCNS